MILKFKNLKEDGWTYVPVDGILRVTYPIVDGIKTCVVNIYNDVVEYNRRTVYHNWVLYSDAFLLENGKTIDKLI